MPSKKEKSRYMTCQHSYKNSRGGVSIWCPKGEWHYSSTRWLAVNEKVCKDCPDYKKEVED